MNALFADTSLSLSGDYADDSLSHAILTMRPGWIALRGCMLDGDAATPARVRYAVLHPQVGIALLDVVPGRTTPQAPDRLRQKLDAEGFRAEFGCIPPILYFCIPLRVLSGVGHLLEQEFRRQPTSALPRGDAWVTAAQAVLSAQPLRLTQQLAGRARQTASHALQRRQRPAQRFGGARLLAAFWGFALSATGGSALYLQYLGPPERAARAALQLSATGAAADLRRTFVENDQAILELQSRLNRPRPEDGTGRVADAVLTSMTPSDAAAEHGTTIALPAEERAGIAEAEAALQQIRADAEDAQKRLADTNAQVERAGQQVTAAEQQLAAVQQQSEDTQTAGAAMSRQLTDAQAQLSRLEERRSAAEQQLKSLQAQADHMQEDRAAIEQAAADQALLAETTEQPVKRPVVQAGHGSQDIAEAETRLVKARRPMDQAISQQNGAAPAVLDDGVGVVAAFGATAPAAPHDNAASRLASFVAALPSPDRAPDPASVALAEAMLRRGNALLQHGDISAARLLYDRASSAGSARAATAMGKIFDPTVLANIGAVGLSPDPALAALWYHRGLSRGDEEARTRLQFLPPAASRAAQAGRP